MGWIRVRVGLGLDRGWVGFGLWLLPPGSPIVPGVFTHFDGSQKADFGMPPFFYPNLKEYISNEPGCLGERLVYVLVLVGLGLGPNDHS